HNIEDDPAPPRPVPLGRLRDEVQVTRPCREAGESRGLPTVTKREAEGAVELDSASHIVRGYRDGADTLNSRCNPSTGARLCLSLFHRSSSLAAASNFTLRSGSQRR